MCRFIADQYSQAQLGRFYAELARGNSVDEASRDTLQLSEAALTAGWRVSRPLGPVLVSQHSPCHRP